MENKKTAGILVAVAVTLFVAVAFVFLHSPTKERVLGQMTSSKAPAEEVTGDLPELVCTSDGDQDSFAHAVAKKDVNSCDCVEDADVTDLCKKTVMDISFYDRALAQLDDALCEKIRSDIQKDSCYKVVASSIKEFEQKDPQYIADMYAVTHNEKAITAYEKLIETDKENIDNYISLALAYAEKGLQAQEGGGDQSPFVEKAFAAIESAKKIDDKMSDVYRAEGYIYEIEPDYVQAIASYDKAIDLDKGNSLAYAGRGHVSRMMGILEKSIEDFTAAAALDENNENVSIYTNLCTLEYSRSHDEDAIKNCKIVTRIDGADPVFQSGAFQIMAKIFIRENDFSQAKNYLLQAKTLTPNDPNLFVALAELNLYEQSYEESESNANRAIEISPTKSAGYLALANSLYMQEKYEQAIEKAEEGIVLVEGDVSLLAPSKPAMERNLNYTIANSYRNLGDEAQQKEYEQKAIDLFDESNSSSNTQ